MSGGGAMTARKRPRTLLCVPGKGSFSGGADVYRAPDGIGVVVVGEGTAVKATPHGPVRITGKVVVELPSIAAFDHWKRIGFHKNPELYAKTVGILGLDDDARHAPPLPPGLLGGGHTPMPVLRLVAGAGADTTSDVAVAGVVDAAPTHAAPDVALDALDAPSAPHAFAHLFGTERSR